MKVLSLVLVSGLCGQFSLFLGEVRGSRILLLNAGGFSSHYLASVAIGKALVPRGHHVTTTIEQGSFDILGDDDRNFPPNMELLNIWVSFPRATLLRALDDYIRRTLRSSATSDDTDDLHPPDYPVQDDTSIFKISQTICKDLFENSKLIAKLEAAKYDMIVGDTVYQCHALLSQKLSVPFIHFGLTTMVPSQHDIFAGNPVSPAYVPERASELTDTLTFRQRLKNMVMYGLVKYFYNKNVMQLIQNLSPEVNLKQLMQEADMWIFSSNFLVDFARPLPPHVVFVGGILTGPPNPLAEELDEFSNSSGDAGVVVITMGTLISSQLTKHQSEAIATSLSLLPQKVVWAFGGKMPSSVGNNTLIVQKIPQNDLLAHSKVRAFISHGGLNSLHESIYHGVPVVCVPVFGDQGDNCVRLQAKGMAVMVEVKKLTDTTLYDAVTEIIQNKRYKEKAELMSEIARDRLTDMSPADKAAYWIEYAIKHGTEHLKPRVLQLSFIEYYMLDILVINAAIIIAIILCIKYTCCSRKVVKATA